MPDTYPGGARIALATSHALPADDLLLADALRATGCVADEALWSDRNIDWSAYSGVVIRSCWDYHRRLPKFLRWVDTLSALRVPLFNSPALVHWNCSKHYLLDLARKHVTIPRTVIVPQASSRRDIMNRLAELGGFGSVVIKPVISASAERTTLASLHAPGTAIEAIEAVGRDGDVMLQEFIEEVRTRGELSLVFIDGCYSHAVRKLPQPGDFRVQAEHGGRAIPASPPPHVIGMAARLVRLLPSVPAYARVDGISRRGDFVLMELELIEPELYLRASPHAASRLADTVLRRTLARDGFDRPVAAGDFDPDPAPLPSCA